MRSAPIVLIERLPAGFNRWEEVLSLINRSFAYMDGVIDPPSSAHRLTAEGLRRKAEDETGFLAVCEGRIVGCVFVVEREHDCYFSKLAVEPELQRQGMGKNLVEAVEEFAMTRGKVALELQTRIELAANHAAFTRLGFRETARTAHEGYDRATSITMRKVLR
ncbi:GNAT family N-acetyltransferase [Allomesorhizobium alhagi]|jgi:GNAT superfamily N-acetyltransferase|uniref:GCN5-like N-acetyltransferase n=1 Tax=Mesorhizobium alhagi CCNWXJ12-2 TaxID=1107882 RepID=H0HJU5_9HYPH|nr:GNAT family N-acetyltransferase [Mesorhizobium alhagi]EHK59008.1 GCN5-like N-acetyltransferase [Mesorhizobium alhagi CCNWXJ12-2]